jgi:hypothetical protein
MTRRFGDRARFCVEVGEVSHNLRVVDLWAGGKWLTTDDNFAFPPTFIHAIRTTAAQVRRGEVSPCFPADLGEVFVGRIPPDEFATVLEDAADLLDAEFAR